ESPTFSASTCDLVARLGSVDHAFVDEGGILEQEYRNLVDREWFDAWFGDRLAAGDIVILVAPPCAEVIRILVRRCGFPPNSRDRHYIALARAIVQGGAPTAVIVSEDLDFFDPRAKAANAKTRQRILRTGSGP